MMLKQQLTHILGARV